MKHALSRALVAHLLGTSLLSASPASAQGATDVDARIDAMQRQILQMQKELVLLRRRAGRPADAAAEASRPRADAGPPAAAAKPRRTAQAAAAPPPPLPGGETAQDHRTNSAENLGDQDTTRAGGPGGPPPAKSDRPTVILPNELTCGGHSYGAGVLCFTPGGFLELAGIARSSNIVSDSPADFGVLPFRNSLLAHEKEFLLTERQSRISGLLQTKIDPTLELSGYYEFDFLGASVTSNDRESESYVPRVRQVFVQLDSLSAGWSVVAGQSWSLLTTNTHGTKPLDVLLPETIDSQLVPGTDWGRYPQFRVSKDIGAGLWAAVSLERPASIFPPSPFAAPDGVTVNYSNAGNQGGFLNSETTYSVDAVPDAVGKVVFEPGFGHFELKGVTRVFSERLLGHTDDTVGYGVGAAATLPTLDGKLDLQASGLVGRGIGRYGTTLLPDVALRSDGSLATIPAFHLLFGAVGHPMPGTELYAYAGIEQEARAGADSTAGYGSPTLITAGCDTEGAPASACQAETRYIRQITGGVWHDLFKGDYGRVVLGGQVAYTQRQAFRGTAGAPAADGISGLSSLRWYPF